jgi:muramoyltetrapeptide carboxypeptidase LdcA involved in peptidoglycan recycling
MFPPKLKPGDTVRVIAPSGSYLSPWIRQEWKDGAVKRLAEWGINVTYGKHLQEIDDFMSSSLEHRLEDFHDAFADQSVRWIACIRGGHNSNQMLRSINYDLIKKNPKVLSGFSDITALSNAIYAKTGLVGYSSPNFYAFGLSDDAAKYTQSAFRRCLFEERPYMIEPSPVMVHTQKEEDSTTHLAPEPNPGPLVIHPGSGEGALLGGNLCTLNLLQGTEYFPDIRGSVLFLEDDYESNPLNLDRDLQSLIHQPGFDQVRGLAIGRFERPSKITDDILRQIIESKRELKKLPIVANLDFGHTQPMFTFPIGGTARMEAKKDGTVRLEIVEH